MSQKRNKDLMELYKAERPGQVVKCRECGKEIMRQNVRSSNNFCSLMCESNFRYRMRHMDPMTGFIPEPDDVKKL